MQEERTDTGQNLARLSAQLQRLRATIARLQDRSLDGIDSLLSVVQAELERVRSDRSPH